MGYQVNHKRMRPKASAPPTAKERAHMDRVAAMPCIVSGERPVTLHHVTASVDGGRRARSHQLIVPLVARLHLIQHGPKESVEAIGHGGFYRMHGVDLLKEAEFLRAESIMEGIL